MGQAQGIGVTAHPQVRRNETDPRNTAESEIWDDNSGDVFYAEDDTDSTIVNGASADISVTVPAQQKCRLELHGHAHVETVGSDTINAALQILVDGVAVPGGGLILDSVAGTIGGNLSHFYAKDVEPGLHTIIVRVLNNAVTADFTRLHQSVLVRRGRQPPPT